MARPIGGLRGEIKSCPKCKEPTGEFLITVNGAHQYQCTECWHGWSETIEVVARHDIWMAEMYGEEF